MQSFLHYLLVSLPDVAERWIATHCSVLVSEVAVKETHRPRCRLHNDATTTHLIGAPCQIGAYTVFNASPLASFTEALLFLSSTLIAVAVLVSSACVLKMHLDRSLSLFTRGTGRVLSQTVTSPTP